MPLSGLLRETLSAAVVAAITLAYGFSFGALLFPGVLEPGVGRGVALTLFGGGVCGLLIAWGTSLRGAVGGPDTPVAAAIAAVSAIALPLVESGELTVAAGIDLATAIMLVTSVLVGLALLAMGLGRVGTALRFIPYPVVGGFVAGSGLYLTMGALQLLVQKPLTQESLSWLLAGERWPQLAAALALPLTVFICRRFWRPFFLLPLVFFTEMALIHLLLAVEGLPVSDAAAGWFLGGVTEGEGGLRPLWSLFDGSLEWSRVIASVPDMAAVIVVAAASVLMNASGLEVAWRKSADLDRELRINGVAGVLSGLGGGAIGTLSLSRSLLNREAGGRTRVSGLLAALVVLLCAFFGSGLAALVPLPVLAGLLLFVGLSLLFGRLRELPPRQTTTDYLLMLVILGMTVVYGYLEGVLTGIVGACLLFAFNYSRIGIVKHILNRRERASDVERPAPQKQLLERHGDLIRMVGLRGYIFFGTSSGLLDRVRATYRQQGGTGPQLLILDFHSVAGMDSSAVISFLRLAHFCEERRVQLCFASTSQALEQVLGSRGDPSLSKVRRFASQEEALEHAEEAVLAWGGRGEEVAGSLERWFQRDAQIQVSSQKLAAFFEPCQVEAGAVVFSQGEPSDSIVLLVSGRVQIVLETAPGKRIRLRSMLEQTVLGEMGFFRNLPRSATVIADQPSLLFRVTRDSYKRMLVEAPDAAAALHRVIIATLSDRLAFANSEIAALKR